MAGAAAALDKSGWAPKHYFILNDEIVKDTEKDSKKCNQQPALTNVKHLAILPSVLFFLDEIYEFFLINSNVKVIIIIYHILCYMLCLVLEVWKM